MRHNTKKFKMSIVIIHLPQIGWDSGFKHKGMILPRRRIPYGNLIA
ncbi:MAG: hypothetical protein ACXABV_04345 [Candidatus Thorarchaeota archaeon]